MIILLIELNQAYSISKIKKNPQKLDNFKNNIWHFLNLKTEFFWPEQPKIQTLALKDKNFDKNCPNLDDIAVKWVEYQEQIVDKPSKNI